MTDKVFIEGLQIETLIGIYDWERRIRQPLVFDVEMAFDNRKPAASDAIEDTLDYKAVSKRLIAFVSAVGLRPGRNAGRTLRRDRSSTNSPCARAPETEQARRGARCARGGRDHRAQPRVTATALPQPRQQRRARAPPACGASPHCARVSATSSSRPSIACRRWVSTARISSTPRRSSTPTSIPFALIDWLHAARKRDNGRIRGHVKFSDRTLDIDLVYFDDRRARRCRTLQLPRPELRHAFVLRPLADIAPSFVDPVRKVTLAELWRAHPDFGGALETVAL